MNRNQLRRAQMRALCGEIHDDDGVDPRQTFDRETSRHKRDRKADQLCHQVRQTVELVLGGEFDDDLLLSLQVISVAPAPNCGRLAVQVATSLPPGAFDAIQIEQRLAEVAPYIRSQVAAAISRKRAPKLAFQLIVRPGNAVLP